MFFATRDGMERESSSSSLQGSQPCRHFEFPEILLATNDFDELLVIGHGGFGKVYIGSVVNGSSVVIAAIKRLDSMSNQGATEFWAEVEMLSKLRHCNLVSLIGYCNHEKRKEMILVYEYMANGTLEDHLHKLRTPLSWLQRLNISIGAARGLHYLHTGTGIEVGVIHRDVKSSNILLDESWAARISDFGLSRISPTNQPSTYVKTIVKGSFGYLDPDYYATGKLTRKSDVYAFGVVLLEVLLCRKRAVDRSLDEEQWNLARWAQESIKEGKLMDIVDSNIRSQISPKCLKEFVRIIKRCLHNDPKQRSTMAGVVVSLESILNLQAKFNNSLKRACKTIFGRMVDKFPFTSNRAPGDSKLSSNSNGNSTSVGNAIGVDHINMLLNTSEVPADYKIQSLIEFKFADLKRATSDFSYDRRLGEGSFGGVFLGWIDKKTFAPSTCGVGIAVAVKWLNEGSVQALAEWQTKVSELEWLAHPNIISLLGYCNDKKHGYLLVYEHMQYKRFDHLLFPDAIDISNRPLSWGTRLMIMIGVARGLSYLHSSRSQIIWGDVKTSNILLDQDFNAKLGNFRLAKVGPETGQTQVSTWVMGIYGYTAPEYVQTGTYGHAAPEYMQTGLTIKSDIYGFGVVLLETLTGVRALDRKQPNGLHHLVEWARPKLARRKELQKIMDPRLEQNFPLESAFEFSELVLRCLAKNPNDRPSSEEALYSLEQLYVVNK